MAIINAQPQQGSPEWVASRKRYVGASQAGTIMGFSQYKTAYQLWQQYMNLLPADEETYAMRRGSDLEPKALKYLEGSAGIKIVSQPVLVHPDYPFMRASLDGITDCGKYIIEAKSPMSVNSATHVQTSMGGVPLNHYAQIQFGIECARHYYPGIVGALYISYINDDPEKSEIIEVNRDDSFIKRIIKEVSIFWDHVKNKTPPKMQDDEYENIELAENADLWHSLLSEYKELDDNEKQIAVRKKELRKKIMEMSEGRNVTGYSVKAWHTEKKGPVNYKKIPELRQVDLEKYRGDPVKSFTIRVCNEKEGDTT